MSVRTRRYVEIEEGKFGIGKGEKREREPLSPLKWHGEATQMRTKLLNGIFFFPFKRCTLLVLL